MVAREYTKHEKMAYVDEFKSSGMSIKAFSIMKGIPESTLREWLKLDRELKFGEIDLKTPSQCENTSTPVIKKTTVFASEDIRIELKEGFDKKFLRKIVEVLIDDN